jgi:hypothetical protein
VFDVATGKVKFGPFYDAQPRTLSYQVLPPVWGVHCALGVFCFSGQASADGVNSPVAGQQCMVLAGYFPADLNPADRRISIGEVTAYGAAWRHGSNWLCHAQEIPIDYVSRAAALWRLGECYTVDALILIEPLWWVPCDRSPRLLPDPQSDPKPAASLSFAERHAPACFVPAEPLTIAIDVAPAPGAMAYAVQDTVPANWSVAEVSEGGLLDPVSRRVKWGPFFDNAQRILSYQATPPATAVGSVDLRGLASFDGSSLVISGSCQIQATGRLRVTCGPQPGQVTLCLIGEFDVRYVIEVSNDLLEWHELASGTTSHGRLEIPVTMSSNVPVQFYRARRTD